MAAQRSSTTKEHFLVFDGVTEVVFQDENPSRTRTEQPITADVDNDGNAEIIFSANAEASFAGNTIAREERVPGLEIWSSADDSWVGARPIWNQHTYHITNVEIDGRIPINEAKSWDTHNSYRLNAAENDALLAPDLTAEASAFDQSRCGESVLIVCAEVYNRGEALVGPGLAVTFYDGDPDMVVSKSRRQLRGASSGNSRQGCVTGQHLPGGRFGFVSIVTIQSASASKITIR